MVQNLSAVSDARVMQVEDLHVLFSHHRSEENEYRVNKAVVGRIGDILSKMKHLENH